MYHLFEHIPVMDILGHKSFCTSLKISLKLLETELLSEELLIVRRY